MNKRVLQFALVPSRSRPEKPSPTPEWIAAAYARLADATNRRHVMHVIEDHLLEEAEDEAEARASRLEAERRLRLEARRER